MDIEKLKQHDTEAQIRTLAEAIRDDFGLDFAVPQEVITVTADSDWGRLTKRLEGVAELLARIYVALSRVPNGRNEVRPHTESEVE